VVGNRAPFVVQNARAERLLAWAVEVRVRRRFRRLLPSVLRRIGLGRMTVPDAAGILAVRAIPDRALA
jgi:hypothetical protein